MSAFDTSGLASAIEIAPKIAAAQMHIKRFVSARLAISSQSVGVKVEQEMLSDYGRQVIGDYGRQADNPYRFLISINEASPRMLDVKFYPGVTEPSAFDEQIRMAYPLAIKKTPSPSYHKLRMGKVKRKRSFIYG